MNKNVPKLRFKEFNEVWKREKLGNLFEFKNGVNADKEAYGKGIKFINVLDILNNNYIDYNNIVGLVDIDEKTLDKYAVNYGDVLFQRSSETREEVGTANVYLGDTTVTFGGFVIRGKKIADYNPRFMNSLLKSSSSRKEIVTKAGGSTRYNVGQEILSDVNTSLPTLQEQERIANFFTILDSLIEEQEAKVNDLELYKKGMMQKIFKQKIRFKDENGQDYPAWEEKVLGDLLVYKSERNKEKRINKVLSISNKRGFIEQSEQFEDREVASSDTKNYKIVYKDDFAFNPSRINVGSIARLKNFDVGIISPMYICFTCINSALVSNYFENFIDTFNFKMQIKNRLEGSVRQTLSFNALENIKIKLPCLEEQTKIANFLSNIDNIIEEEQNNLDDLKEMKKGLLQQMFV